MSWFLQSGRHWVTRHTWSLMPQMASATTFAKGGCSGPREAAVPTTLHSASTADRSSSASTRRVCKAASPAKHSPNKSTRMLRSSGKLAGLSMYPARKKLESLHRLPFLQRLSRVQRPSSTKFSQAISCSVKMCYEVRECHIEISDECIADELACTVRYLEQHYQS